MDPKNKPNSRKSDHISTKKNNPQAEQLLLKQPQKSLKCGFCDFKARNPSTLLKHVRSHTGEKPYKCPHPNCEATFGANDKMKRHQLVHNKGDESLIKFKCFTCPYKTGIKENLEKHVKIHSDVRAFKCDLCPYRAKQHGGLLSHKKHAHSTEKPFKCPQANCSYSFKVKSQLIKHMQVHSDDKPFACSFAGCAFKTKWSGPLKIHEMAHRGENAFKCSFCSYQCNSKSSLEFHLRTHTGETPFSCSNCPYRATNRSNVNRHMLIHSNDQPFACSVANCDFTTKWQNSFQYHKLTHVEEKLFKCPFCAYTCNYKGRLNCHIRVHTGEAPFACQKCPYRSKHSSELRNHKRVKHGEKKPNTRATADILRDRKRQFPCKMVECGFSAGKISVLAIHLNEVHSLPRVHLVNIK